MSPEFSSCHSFRRLGKVETSVIADSFCDDSRFEDAALVLCRGALPILCVPVFFTARLNALGMEVTALPILRAA